MLSREQLKTHKDQAEHLLFHREESSSPRSGHLECIVQTATPVAFRIHDLVEYRNHVMTVHFASRLLFLPVDCKK